MKTIPLTQGKVALVDDADYEWLSQWRWCAHKNSRSNVFYAVRGKRVIMHKEIMGPSPAPGLVVDHWDLDGCNNQRANLRWATLSQQRQNTRAFKNNKSGFKGVCPAAGCRPEHPWMAQIKIAGKSLYLGLYPTPELAAAAYNAAARKHFGEFAWLNPGVD